MIYYTTGNDETVSTFNGTIVHSRHNSSCRYLIEITAEEYSIAVLKDTPCVYALDESKAPCVSLERIHQYLYHLQIISELR